MIRALTKPFSSAATIREAFGARTDLLTVSLIVASLLRLVSSRSRSGVSIYFGAVALVMETVTMPEAGAKVDVEASGIVGGREAVVPAQICHQNVNEMEEEKMVLF